MTAEYTQITATRSPTVCDLFDRACKFAPDKDALGIDGQAWTYGMLRQSVDSLASALKSKGVAKGDRLALWLPNSAELITCILAAAEIGAVAVPLNTRFRSSDIGAILERIQPRMLMLPEKFLDIDFIKLLQDAYPDLTTADNGEAKLENLKELTHVLRFACNALQEGQFAELIAARGRAEPAARVEVRSEDPFVILYTSGSSGSPKGAIISHGAFTWHSWRLAKQLAVTNQDRIYSAQQLCHIGCLSGAWALALQQGAAFYSHSTYEVGQTISTLTDSAITIHRTISAIGRDLLADPRLGQHRFPNLRTIIMSSPSHQMYEQTEKAFPFARTMNSYGLTEACGVVSISADAFSKDQRWETMGRPLEGFEVLVVEPETAEPVGTGQEGEILVRGPGLMNGYFGLTDEEPQPMDENGWYYTGDFGRLDEMGNLTFSGRKNARLRVGGENVNPEEVEVFLRSHPHVRDACVVSVADERLGEVPVAFVVPSNPELASSTLSEFCATSLARFKRPVSYIFRSYLPLNAAHKVDRVRLQTVARNVATAPHEARQA